MGKPVVTFERPLCGSPRNAGRVLGRALVRACALVAGLTIVGLARAEHAVHSPYEISTIEAELTRRNLEVEPRPEGKRISSVEIIPLDVFDETDPVPDFLNVFHVTTRERIIQRELLFRVGEPFRLRRIDETVRNLRSSPELPQLSLVLIVAARDPDGDGVRLLVITKDVWSLRLNWNAQVGPDGLTYLLLNPSELNLLGTHATVGGSFQLLRSTYALGINGRHPRIFGTRLTGGVSTNIILNRHTDQAEGSFGNFYYGLPRYAETQLWSYGTALTWSDSIARVSLSTDPKDPLATSKVLGYHAEHYEEVVSATRSYGRRHKFDLTFGLEADRRAYQSRAPVDTEPALRERFEQNEIPLSDTRIGPFVQFSQYDNEFMKTIELETLGLQEEFRLGPEVLMKVYAASSRTGSTRDLVGIFTGLSYTLRAGDGLLRAVVTSSGEYARDGKDQAIVAGALRFASPRLGFGRLVVDGVLENRYRNYLRERSALGGNSRLRGYSSADTEAIGSGALRGADALVANAEFRTRGVDILSAQCGLAAFYDVGGAAPRMGALGLRHSVGWGARVLLPEFDRVVFRVDWAFPLSAGAQTFPGALFFTVGQAFLMPKVGRCLSCTLEPRGAAYGLSDVTW